MFSIISLSILQNLCLFVVHVQLILALHIDLIANDWIKYLIHSRMMATNYIGAFCLTKLLLPLLTNSPVPSRIVNVSSFTHRSGKLVLGYVCQTFFSEYSLVILVFTITIFIFGKSLYTCNCCLCSTCSTLILCWHHNFGSDSEISVRLW